MSFDTLQAGQIWEWIDSHQSHRRTIELVLRQCDKSIYWDTLVLWAEESIATPIGSLTSMSLKPCKQYRLRRIT